MDVLNNGGDVMAMTEQEMTTAVEVGTLNRSNPWATWQVDGHDVDQTATLAVFIQAMHIRDDLALRVGGEVA